MKMVKIWEAEIKLDFYGELNNDLCQVFEAWFWDFWGTCFEVEEAMLDPGSPVKMGPCESKDW